MNWQYKPLEDLMEDLISEQKNIRNDLNKFLKHQVKTAKDYADIKNQILEMTLEESPALNQGKVSDPGAPSPWHPVTFLGLDVETAGFTYEPLQDIIYSTMYNYQRLLGYCRFYDDSSFLILSRLDCEVIIFEYESWQYMIELWKGQYGIETGGEIGIYRRRKDKPLTKLEKEVTGPLYPCVPDDARLPMSFELSKQGDSNFHLKREQLHWWLTGFHWGIFSSPEELEMNLAITFPDSDMLDSFHEAVKKLGYSQKDINIENKKISFVFKKPYTPQPKTQEKLGPYVQKINETAVSLYTELKNKLGISSNDPNLIWNKLVQNAGPEVRWLLKYIKKYFNNRLAIR